VPNLYCVFARLYFLGLRPNLKYLLVPVCGRLLAERPANASAGRTSGKQQARSHTCNN